MSRKKLAGNFIQVALNRDINVERVDICKILPCQPVSILYPSIYLGLLYFFSVYVVHIGSSSSCVEVLYNFG